MPATSMLTYFVSYFNITTQPYFIVKDSPDSSGALLTDFLAAHGADIIANDSDYNTENSVTSLVPAIYSGNILNNLNSTQKWIQPVPNLLNSVVGIALIMYTNYNSTPQLLLRVSNASISTSAGYPGIEPIP